MCQSFNGLYTVEHRLLIAFKSSYKIDLIYSSNDTLHKGFPLSKINKYHVSRKFSNSVLHSPTEVIGTDCMHTRKLCQVEDQ